VRPLGAKDLDRLCRLAAAGDVGLSIAHARRGRWVFALKRKLPRDVAGRLLYPQRIYITDLGRTLAKMCP
jgi:hypothetical protein